MLLGNCKANDENTVDLYYRRKVRPYAEDAITIYFILLGTIVFGRVVLPEWQSQRMVRATYRTTTSVVWSGQGLISEMVVILWCHTMLFERAKQMELSLEKEGRAFCMIMISKVITYSFRDCMKHSFH